jgi:hypothetical protein
VLGKNGTIEHIIQCSLDETGETMNIWWYIHPLSKLFDIIVFGTLFDAWLGEGWAQ